MKRLCFVCFVMILIGVSASACGRDTADPIESENETFLSAQAFDPLRIRTDGDYLVVGALDDPQRIWINGVNTPWNHWNDFVGNNFDYTWWDEHFALLRENGVNATRIWIMCTNNYGRGNRYGQGPFLDMDENGMIHGVDESHWRHLDDLFTIAERHGVYIMATFMSFDHFQYNEWHNADPYRWRRMLQSPEAIASFVTHYTLPFVERFRNNPFLWSIDLMNEPDWVHENVEAGQLPWRYLSLFFAMNTAAIRQNSNIHVTVGMAFPKYNSDLSGYEGNKVSDAFMQNLYTNPYAALDFWSPHYYDWVEQWYGHPFTSRPFGTRARGGWGLCDSRPALIGETTAQGTEGFTLTEDYMNAFANGWQGVMAWTSNAVDWNGGFEDVFGATRYFYARHPELVFPHIR
ncbi:MAG: cellulase (glycosyl hydrolase family 5) [Defluviitaleaceae bacterium]|nr:cellulase (glycosyl hydrolase family 5) [Defluviitaleaceae bacterium]